MGAVDADGNLGSRPEIEPGRASRFFDAARDLFGTRFAEARWDDHRDLLVTVHRSAESDAEAFVALAVRCGVDPDRVHLETADPADLAAWERLRQDLDRWAAEPGRGGLDQSPGTDSDYQRPPVTIRLAPGAEDVAADLHARYGAFVDLTVGAFGYPLPADAAATTGWNGADARERVDPAEFDVALDGPLTVASGETVTHHVLLANHGVAEAQLGTNGTITADVVDAAGAVVGGYVGAQILPLVFFSAPPGGTVRIPLLVGTASLRPELGYAVPPGEWQVSVPLDLADGRRLVSAPLPVTVVARG